MDYEYRARALLRKAVSKHHMLSTVHAALMVCAQFSTGKGKLKAFFNWSRFVLSIISMCHLEEMVFFWVDFSQNFQFALVEAK